MKTKSIITSFLILISAVSVYAQGNIRKETRQKIKSLKIAFITDELSLTEKEAQKFWPIYNVHEEAIHSIRKQEGSKIRNQVKKQGGFEALTDKQAKEILNEMMVLEEKTFRQNQTFKKKLLKFLPPKKIIKLEFAERKFKQKMFEKLKRRRHKE